MAFRRATEEEGNAAVREVADTISGWLIQAKVIWLSSGEKADIADILQQKLGDRLGTQEGEIESEI